MILYDQATALPEARVSEATLIFPPIEILTAEEAAAHNRSEKGGQLARIGGLRNMFEAEILGQALADHRIWCAIEPHRDSALSDIFVLQRGWGSLIVLRDQAEAALGILQQIREAVNAPFEDPPEELREIAEDAEEPV